MELIPKSTHALGTAQDVGVDKEIDGAIDLGGLVTATLSRSSIVCKLSWKLARPRQSRTPSKIDSRRVTSCQHEVATRVVVQQRAKLASTTHGALVSGFVVAVGRPTNANLSAGATRAPRLSGYQWETSRNSYLYVQSVVYESCFTEKSRNSKIIIWIWSRIGRCWRRSSRRSRSLVRHQQRSGLRLRQNTSATVPCDDVHLDGGLCLRVGSK